MEDVELLSGGNVTPVVRVGNTVHRNTGPWSPAVHRLLRHLEEKGFDGAPRFLGLDDEGREILTFIPGEVGRYPFPGYMWSDAVLMGLAKLMRRFHDATIGFTPAPADVWQLTYPDSFEQEVICHNDIAPYNVVFMDELPRVLIDFDMAGPGSRTWDVAYAAYRVVPFSYSADLEQTDARLIDPAHQARRLRLLCAAYGGADISGVLDSVEPRLHTLCATLTQQARAGNQAFQRMIDEGHLAHYQSEIAAWRRHQGEVRRLLAEV